VVVDCFDLNKKNILKKVRKRKSIANEKKKQAK